MRLRLRVTVLLLTGAAIAAIAVVPLVIGSELVWRARVVQAKASGALPEIPLRDLLRWLAPASPVHLASLATIPNVHAGIQNPFMDADSAESGSRSFGKLCADCHGETARGKTGPDLIAAVASATDWAYFSAVKWGREGTAMAAQPLSDREIWQTHTYLRDLAIRSLAADDQKPAASRRGLNVRAEAIVASAERPHEWLTYAGHYAGHRHSTLSQISKENVRDLRVAWVAQLRSADPYLESSPIVAGGLVFVTTSPDGVVALDARTGQPVWQFQRPVPSNLPLCCAAANRGVAILGDALFVATLDARLIALDASTGRKRWETVVAEPRDGYSMTGAPLALHDRVLVGVAGGEYGIRGFVAAFSAADGRLLWKFNTIPAPGEPGSETWTGDSWRTGGVPTWTTGAYDPKLDLVYWGVGDPTLQGTAQPGDSLFSNSIIALESKTGRLRWHFQLTPADEHGYDAVQQPMLADMSWQGKPRAAVLQANRNGFFYALDRETGQFLFAKPFVKQTWVAGLEPNGRPIRNPEARPTRTGRLVWPGVTGGTNWWPPSYDRRRQLVYVPFVDAAGVFFFEETARVEKGVLFKGSWGQTSGNQPVATGLKAIDAETGEIRWETELARGGADVLRIVGGVLSTSRGLVFAGYADTFYAFDADNGAGLWNIRVGGRINAAPVSYAIDDQQFVAVMAGPSLFVFSLPSDKEMTDLKGARKPDGRRR